MGLFDFLTGGKKNKQNGRSQFAFADSSSIDPEEKQFYQPDDYYTFYAFPGTDSAHKVITFEERKKISFPSKRGLYVAEILLLDYCRQGKYPKPTAGYPGLWWFEYGIRDVGHALESLRNRGFIQWAPKANSLHTLKVDELKRMLETVGLPANGKKEELIERVAANIPEQRLVIPGYVAKYELTDLGHNELEENGYVPYMHKHSEKTTDDDTFGEPFNVWSINRLFRGETPSDWRTVVGQIEKHKFGVDTASSSHVDGSKESKSRASRISERDEMRAFLASKKREIQEGIHTPGDGFAEESKGMMLRSKGDDKAALVMFYISIGKRFDAPALYRETAILLRKYGMLEEELKVVEAGIRNSGPSDDLLHRKERVTELIEKNKGKK
ncbi:MAG: SAP domain-containing protein [Clostridia bacterium]|nr:SAP domain-containing protein [Clostridia bacterium]